MSMWNPRNWGFSSRGAQDLVAEDEQATAAAVTVRVEPMDAAQGGDVIEVAACILESDPAPPSNQHDRLDVEAQAAIKAAGMWHMRLEEQLEQKMQQSALLGMPFKGTNVDTHFEAIKAWAADPDQGGGAHKIIKQETVAAVKERKRSHMRGIQRRIVCECYGKPPAGSPSKKTECKWVVWIEEGVKVGDSDVPPRAQKVSIVTKAVLQHNHSCEPPLTPDERGTEWRELGERLAQESEYDPEFFKKTQPELKRLKQELNRKRDAAAARLEEHGRYDGAALRRDASQRLPVPLEA